MCGVSVGHFAMRKVPNEEESEHDSEPEIEETVEEKNKANLEASEEFTEAMAKVQEVIDSGEPFTDPEFPPCNESIA